MNQPDDRPLDERVAKRLAGLVNRVRDGQLTEREVIYLAAVLDHFHAVRTDWRNAND